MKNLQHTVIIRSAIIFSTIICSMFSFYTPPRESQEKSHLKVVFIPLVFTLKFNCHPSIPQESSRDLQILKIAP